MIWYKYRHNWKEGKGIWDYDYLLINEPEDIDENVKAKIEGVADYTNYDGYRGYDFEVVELKDVPVRCINYELKIARENMQYYETISQLLSIEYFTKKDLNKEKGEGNNVDE